MDFLNSTEGVFATSSEGYDSLDTSKLPPSKTPAHADPVCTGHPDDILQLPGDHSDRSDPQVAPPRQLPHLLISSDRPAGGGAGHALQHRLHPERELGHGPGVLHHLAECGYHLLHLLHPAPCCDRHRPVPGHHRCGGVLSRTHGGQGRRHGSVGVVLVHPHLTSSSTVAALQRGRRLRGPVHHRPPSHALHLVLHPRSFLHPPAAHPHPLLQNLPGRTDPLYAQRGQPSQPPLMHDQREHDPLVLPCWRRSCWWGASESTARRSTGEVYVWALDRGTPPRAGACFVEGFPLQVTPTRLAQWFASKPVLPRAPDLWLPGAQSGFHIGVDNRGLRHLLVAVFCQGGHRQHLQCLQHVNGDGRLPDVVGLSQLADQPPHLHHL